MAEFVMPALGADMEAGRLIAWMKKPGDRIERGEIIAEIDTDKGLIEVECFATGVIEKLLINPGDKVPVGTVLASIREEGMEAREAERPKEKPAAALDHQFPQSRACAAENFPRREEDGRRIGNRPDDHYGHGAGGRITHEDVERAAAARTAARRSRRQFNRPFNQRTRPIAPRECGRPSPRRWPDRSVRFRITT